MRDCIIIVLLVMFASLVAAPVSIADAEVVAKNLCLERSGNITEIESIKELREESEIVMYAVNFKNGFVILSADDIAFPVWGYSFEGRLNLPDMPPQMKAFLSWHKKEILAAKEENVLPSSKTIREWERLREVRFSPQTNLRNVAPLLNTTWNQGQYYNQLCPADPDGPGGHVWAGCVATAMAQVMKYWSFPETGIGSHSYYHWQYGTQSADFGDTTYQWDYMPNNVTSYNSSVATLLYHLGVSVDMDYGINGSGAYGSDALDALIDYFAYSSDAQLLSKNSYSSTAWASMLRSELEAGRPLYYRGQNSSSGHAFNLDGYQSSEYFHFNWGWSGYNNGYFYLDDLTPGNHNYTMNQAAIFYLEPTLQPEITVITPNGGETFAIGDEINITWDSQDIGDNVSIFLYLGNAIDEVISASTVNDGSYLWTIPANSSLGDTFKIKVMEAQVNSIYDYSDDFFAIYDPIPEELESVAITISSAEINTGEDCEITVSTNELSPEWNIISYQFSVLYDESTIEFTGYSAGDFNGNLLAYEGTLGHIDVAFANAMPLSGAGNLVTLQFSAVQAGNSIIDIPDFRYNIYDIDNIIPGNVTVDYYNPYEGVVISAGSGEVNVSESIEIPITTSMLTSEMGTISFQFNLNFDPEKVSYTNSTLGDVPLPGNFLVNVPSPGILSVAYANVMPITGEGNLCTIIFTGESEGSSILDLEQFRYNSTDIEDLVNGSIMVNTYDPFEDVVITAGSGETAIGGTIAIPVSTSMINTDLNILSFQFDLEFDNSLLSFQEVTLGEVPNPGSILANESSPGVLSVAYANVNPIVGEGNLCYLTFFADNPGTSPLSLSEFKYNTTYLDNLIDGSLDISAVQYPDWNINPPDYEYNGSIWGIVLLDDEEVTLTSGMLGCFVGDQCRGIASLEEGSILDFTVPFGHIIFLPMVYSNETSGETLEFLYFDAITQEVYPIAETIPWQADMVIGNGYDPFEFHASTISTVDLTKDIVSGWNWFSINAQNEDMSINNVLASLGESGANIKNQTQSAIYYQGAGWFGSLNNLNNTSLYKLEAVENATFQFTGVPVDLNNTTYNFTSGWNWISFAPQQPEQINYALGDLQNGANIKNQTQSAIYYDGAGWFGSLNTLFPLGGYMLQMNDAEIFNYPLPESTTSFPQPDLADFNLIRDPTWNVNPPDYEYNGSIWGTVLINNNLSDDINDMIGVFVGDECRGLADKDFYNSVIDYTDPFGHIAFIPMVYSNLTYGETLSFKFYDASQDIIYDLDQTLQWEADMTVGDGINPYVFYVTNNDSQNDQIQATHIINCYPNPFNPEVSISFFCENDGLAELSIYNSRGQKVADIHQGNIKAGSHTFIWNGTDQRGNQLGNGVYLYRLKTNDISLSGKMIMLK